MDVMREWLIVRGGVAIAELGGMTAWTAGVPSSSISQTSNKRGSIVRVSLFSSDYVKIISTLFPRFPTIIVRGRNDK